MCEVFARRKTFGTSGYPFNARAPRSARLRSGGYPGTLAALERILVVPWNDRYDEDDVRYIAERNLVGRRRAHLEVASMKKKRFAIVGAGAIARAYETAFATMDNARHRCGLRRGNGGRQGIRATRRLPAYPTSRHLLAGAEFDAAVVCTPPASHESITCELLSQRQARSVRETACGERHRCRTHGDDGAPKPRHSHDGFEVSVRGRRA